MKKKFSLVVMMLVLSLLIIPTGLASASTTESSNSPSLSYQSPIITVEEDGQTSTITSAPGNDNVEIQATNPFTLSISDPSYGTVRGSWTYDNPGKIVNKVAITMELQYRTSFLDLTWDTIDSYNFIYGGGLGSHEGNEHTFRISDKGQYRVKILGQVSFIGGHHDVLMYSGVRSYEGGGIIISDEPEAK
ncbi:hypothetical protein KQI74_15485 [Paenibacillus barcinonensis]|jgi:hypothetical protein|uniref:hypothetical protein n=1 Tax=Paenibacillus TaxID=44249 RepID=UPI001C1007B2|nr:MULTISPECIES: hypothetical protein [Paenibacillus]MBU5353695.1 hypothetical protein [Paenibacillus barcinonensis]MDM5279335.1 hypothetical protein [Paenibacillus silvae]